MRLFRVYWRTDTLVFKYSMYLGMTVFLLVMAMSKYQIIYKHSKMSRKNVTISVYF